MLSPPWTYPPPSCFAMTLNFPGSEGSLAMAAATFSMAATVSGSSASAAALAALPFAGVVCMAAALHSAVWEAIASK